MDAVQNGDVVIVSVEGAAPAEVEQARKELQGAFGENVKVVVIPGKIDAVQIPNHSTARPVKGVA